MAGVCCKTRFPCPHAVQNHAGAAAAAAADGTYNRFFRSAGRIHESCLGGICSRSCSPPKPRPALWEPKPGPYYRTQTAPAITVAATFQPPQPPDSWDRPTSAQSARSNRSNRSNRSYESCQYSNCSRSPCLTPRAFDEPTRPYEPARPISPAGWTYSPKRVTRRGRWWDRDWKITERFNNYRNPDLQQCGCHKTKLHSGSRTPSPARSPRAVGLAYHFNRIANAADRRFRGQRSTNPPRTRVRTGRPQGQRGSFGHCHQYQNWSCSSPSPRSRSGSPKQRSRSRTPSPPRSVRPGGSPREWTPPARPQRFTSRPQTPRSQQEPVLNSHGHCHTYNKWSCTPSNRNSPWEQSPVRSRDPTPSPPASSPGSHGGTTTIKVSYTPTGAGSDICEHDMRPEDEGHKQQQQQEVQDYNIPSSEETSRPAALTTRLLLSHCHCHHCHHHHSICPTCGHSHGHHGRTLFSLKPPSAPSGTSCGCVGARPAQPPPAHHGRHHHFCHCFHHCHHH